MEELKDCQPCEFSVTLQTEAYKVSPLRTEERRKMKVGNPKLYQGNSEDDLSIVPWEHQASQDRGHSIEM